ncbi:MAG TPA: M14 family zinc carboxypeptidase [Pilimelia sp.]|nr:M14 family zinc carboxypeptidase [Pilimelia sp.]
MRWRAALAAALLVTGAPLAVHHGGPAGAAPVPSGTGHAPVPAVTLADHEVGLVRLELPSREVLRQLLAAGADLASRPRPVGDRVLADLVLTGRELTALTARGARPVQLVQRAGDGPARHAESLRAATRATAAGLRADARTASSVDTLHARQAYWWTAGGQTFLQTQVATTAAADPDVEITVTWRTADGATGSYPLTRFSDAGEYQYHVALPQPVPARPTEITAVSSLGGALRPTAPARWVAATPPPAPSGYQRDFIDAYLTPVDIRARIARLARQYRGLVDVIDLPHRTQGYRRTAAAHLGDPAGAAVVVESVPFGDQYGNGVQVRAVDPGAPNRPLTARLRDRVLTVSLATDATGAPVSTTDQVAALITEQFRGRLTAFVPDGAAGRTLPPAGPVRLDDGLSGDAPPRPWTVQALRIGLHRDGSRVGVLAYSQEHGREWATPLVTLEFAERLLANARTDPATRRLLAEVDVFVIPTVNPDGANYSFADYALQRKNLANHCAGAQRDPRLRNAWGVDVNRNYTVGSYFDGYAGASANCLSGTYAGPAELSEPESRNVIALAAAHRNIRFAMNVHSYGGYFMWPPGAYQADGRITLPRPSIEESAFFLASAKRIVGAIAAERGTVTWPSRTGPVADVLYSAAGNSADQLYYELGIFAWNFEVGNDRWNPATGRWEGVGFQPPFPEAHAEAMEYADGLVELLRVAADYGGS